MLMLSLAAMVTLRSLPVLLSLLPLHLPHVHHAMSAGRVATFPVRRRRRKRGRGREEESKRKEKEGVVPAAA